MTIIFLSLVLIGHACSQSIGNQVKVGDGTAYSLTSPRNGNCNLLHTEKAAETQYAALNGIDFEMKMCGQCVQVECIDARCTSRKKRIVQILDQCPGCQAGDIDLSPPIFRQVTGSGPSRLQMKWKYVKCPRKLKKGPPKFCLKEGSNPYWLAIQPLNIGHPVEDLTINGQRAILDATKLDAFYFVLAGPRRPIALSQRVDIRINKGPVYQVKFNQQQCSHPL